MPLLFNSDGDTGESNHLLELEDEDAYFGRAVEQKQFYIDMQLHYACANGDPVNVRSFLRSPKWMSIARIIVVGLHYM